jgi:hypothetical protein
MSWYKNLTKMSDLDEKQTEAAPPRPGPRLAWLGIAVGIVVVVWAIYYFAYYRKPVSTLDGFAKCLTKNGAKMYGAWWCTHCADQKKFFGFAFQYVNYIECSPPGQRTQNDVCKQVGLKGYPTWQFADGTRAEGALHLEALSEKTGCKLP